MLEIKHLKTLEALSREGNLVKAAESLNMTQSALSHQIKLLETQLETELFKRKTHPLQFTPAGQLILESSRNILPQMQQLERQLVALQQGEIGRLWIGIDCHTCFEWLLPLLRPYQTQWPSVDLDIVPSFHEPPLQKLPSQKLDFVVTSDPEPLKGVDYTALFSYELVAVLPLDHSLLAKPFLTPKDFSNLTLITYPVPEEKLDVFKQFLHPAKIRPEAISFSELTIMMLQRVEAGRGICVLPKWLVKKQTDFQHLPTRSLSESGLWSKLYAATPKALTKQAYMQDMINLIAERMEL
ncbi:LysR family transcriptional regulator [Thiomicrorhabdus indica]|uniref:LysR family transcriptional regulator n=1 Tax=Thiomicrorhabdus indica TaxID=2267253 RepID=UPI00102D721D|nr:LysR family transcriptional regulator [Thiomicrorhabdus indica]